MSTSVFFDRFYELCKRNGTSPNAVGALMGAASGSITAWKRGVMPRAGMVRRIADHFGVTVDYLLGNDEEVTHREISDEELKFALFGGDGVVTDAMLEEVRQFAQFIKTRK